MPASESARLAFDLRIERVYLALRLALADDADACAALAAEQERCAQALAAHAVRAPERWLASRLELSPDALDFAHTVAAFDVDPRVPPLAARIGGAGARWGASLSLHAATFQLDGPRGRALARELGPGAALVRERIIAAAQDGLPLVTTPWRMPARVRTFLAGDDGVDPSYARFGGRLVAPPQTANLGHRTAQETLVRALAEAGRVLVTVEGADGVGRREAVARAAAKVGRPVIELDLARWDARSSSIEAAVADWRRECLLAGAIGLVARIDLLEDDHRLLAHLIDGIDDVVVVTNRPGRGALPVERPIVRVALATPDPHARRTAWARALGDAADVDLDLVAHRYRLGEPAIDRAVRAARLLGDDVMTTSTIIEAVRAGASERLGDLAITVPTTQSWDDLVLPEDTLDQVLGLIARVRHAHCVLDVWGFASRLPRGQGIAALLSGPPGTGKTMVAGIVARELELELLQVDLSRVVSKYVGETEKQLSSVFDAAEAGHALLLFDEADALFARRTEVKGANDRYANLEVNYLLQRVEAFGGIVLLTTNLETAIDPAVKRRLGTHIVFDPPDEELRAALWRRMIPPGAPFAGALDAEALAHAYPQMTGAHIRNATISAAFLAAADGNPLSQPYLEAAALAEYESSGRVIAGPRGATR